MRRREFIAGLGSAAACPLAARALQGERMRRVGVLTSLLDDDPDAQAEMAALHQELAEHGWIEGRRIDVGVRWGRGRLRRSHSEGHQARGTPG
jgi:putative tryptophan/tyrosine transport system substrate-binding protein